MGLIWNKQSPSISSGPNYRNLLCRFVNPPPPAPYNPIRFRRRLITCARHDNVQLEIEGETWCTTNWYCCAEDANFLESKAKIKRCHQTGVSAEGAMPPENKRTRGRAPFGKNNNQPYRHVYVLHLPFWTPILDGLMGKQSLSWFADHAAPAGAIKCGLPGALVSYAKKKNRIDRRWTIQTLIELEPTSYVVIGTIRGWF